MFIALDDLRMLFEVKYERITSLFLFCDLSYFYLNPDEGIKMSEFAGHRYAFGVFHIRRVDSYSLEHSLTMRRSS